MHKDKKKIENIEFIKSDGQKVSLNDYISNPLIINFWATWCAPCKKEMPSLDKLKILNEFKNINIIPINIGGESYKKSKEFFEQIISLENNNSKIKTKAQKRLRSSFSE